MNRIDVMEIDKFLITFDYDPTLVAAVKQLPGRWFHPADKGRPPYWTVPGSSVMHVRELVRNFRFTVTDAAIELGKRMRAQLEDSQAPESDFEVKGLAGELHPYQKAGVKYALRAKRCFIGDEMGLGKTMEAIGVIQAAQAFPALVVCPMTVKIKWQREVHKWLPERTAVIAEGSKLPKGDVVIINWDILNRHVYKEGADYLPSAEMLERGFKAVVLDESHYAKNYRAQRTISAKTLAHMVEYRLCLTGTPLLSRPIEFLSQLIILGRLGDVGGFWGFTKRYCNAHKIYVGRREYWDFKGHSHTDELNERMRASCYIRRLKKDVKQDLPPKTHSIIPIEITNSKEYQKAFEKLMKKLAHLTEAQQLVEIEYQKQLAVKGKMATAIKWIEEFLESGEKLVVFAHHNDVVLELAKRFKAPYIMGGESKTKRQKAQDDFQSDPNCKLIVCSKAGGVGIDLYAASNVAFLELWWTPSEHDQAEDRLHREGQLNPVTCYYLVGKDTIDEQILDVIQEKREVVTSAVDGKPIGAGTTVLGDLIARLKGTKPVKKPSGKCSKTSEFAVRTTRTPKSAPRKTVAEVDNAERVKQAILFLYQRQTSDEQVGEDTRHSNAVGFNAIDARFGSKLAEWIMQGRQLSPKQVEAAAKMLRKYKRQLRELAITR